MADLTKYVKLKRSETCGFGFSILGGAGSELPPIIYDIIEGSPAANSHQLAPGDVIWEVNGQEVITYTTKEVLNCLRLSATEVTLKLKEDSNVQARAKEYLSGSRNPELLRSAITQDDLQGVRHIKANKPPALHTPTDHSNSSSPTVFQSPTLSVGSGHSVGSHGSQRSNGSRGSNRTISENGLSPVSDRTSSENERNKKKPKKEDGVNNKVNNSASVRSSGSVNTTSPPLSEDESDIESLHSFHYSPKAVDMPSALRLAKRLYGLEGFKKSDVSRHLSKNNEFSRAVAEEYLHYFEFSGDTLDVSLRKFLDKFCLAGETQERERVLVHFSHRFLECNPGTFNSQDAVHTLTCAIMLLNTDLHGQSVGRKMTCNEFIDNLADLNDGDNFPREVLKLLYLAIRNLPLQWATDDDGESTEANNTGGSQSSDGQAGGGSGPLVAAIGSNPFLAPPTGNGIQYKKGYIMRKCCTDPNGKKTSFGKRSWKMWFCVIQDLVLYLHKDEQGARKGPHPQLGMNAIRLHHAMATRAQDYAKKEHVFRLETADQAEYLLQTSDSKELQAWMDTINFVAASLSAPPLPGACGSQKKFQRPLLPCSVTKLNLHEQLEDHTSRLAAMEKEIEEHKAQPPDKNARAHTAATYKEKEAHLIIEIKRYGTYVLLLRSRLSAGGGSSSGGVLVSGSNGSSSSGSGALEVGDLPVFEAGDNSIDGGGQPQQQQQQPQQQQQQRVVPPPIPERNVGRGLPADSPEPPPKSPFAVRRQQDLSASSVVANGGDTNSYLLSPTVFSAPESQDSYLLSPTVFSGPESREPSQERSWSPTTPPPIPPHEYQDMGTPGTDQEESGGGGLMGTLKKKKKEKEEREKKDKFQKEMERKEKELEKKRKEEEKQKKEEDKKNHEKEKKEKEKELKEQEKERKEQEKQEKKERERQVKEEKKNKEKEEKEKRKSLAAVMEWEKQRGKASNNDKEEEFAEDPKVGTLNRLSALFKFSKLNQNTDGDIDNEPEQQQTPLISQETSFPVCKPPPLPPKPSPNSAIMKNTGTRIDL